MQRIRDCGAFSSKYNILFVMRHYFWGDMNSHLPTPVRELMIDQSKDTTNDQHGQPLSFIMATYRTLMGVYLQEQTQRQLYQQSPYQHV